jgi:hypothetical protein
MRKIIHFLVACFGWKIDLNRPTHIKKGVVVMAPHTSNWDFVLGRLAFYTMGIKGRYIMKKEIFIFPLNIFLKALGAIPVIAIKTITWLNKWQPSSKKPIPYLSFLPLKEQGILIQIGAKGFIISHKRLGCQFYCLTSIFLRKPVVFTPFLSLRVTLIMTFKKLKRFSLRIKGDFQRKELFCNSVGSALITVWTMFTITFTTVTPF